MTVGPRVKLEMCVLPFANGSLYQDLKSFTEGKPLFAPLVSYPPASEPSSDPGSPPVG